MASCFGTHCAATRTDPNLGVSPNRSSRPHY
uniref:Uncharacterized protein n=1 Tax=Rhizophora mucronata TaxID=61149 RepID=A0A2P2Q054_RHIMU